MDAISGFGKVSESSVKHIYKGSKDDSFKKQIDAAMSKNDEQELRKVCRDFESILLQSLYSQMKATVQKAELIPESAGHSILESMLDEKLVEEAAKNKGIGLADVLYKQLVKQIRSNNRDPEESNSDKPL